MDKVTPEKVAAAIKATEYKYFGDYEMSDDQREAVEVLVSVAKAYYAPATPAPDSEKLREAGEYVAGPVYRSSMEPEGDVWSAEVQITGGHYVAAEVYGSTEAEARTRQSAIIAALGASL